MKYNFDEIIDRNNTNSTKYGTARMMHPELPEDFIPMWIADMDFACPQPVLDAMKARLDKRILGYSFILDPEYYAAVVGWMKRRYDWDVNPDCIVFSGGIIKALNVAVQRLTKPGDGIIVQTPAYHPFHDAVVNNGRTAVLNPLVESDGYYTMDFADLEAKAKDPNNKLLFLCNPHNPSGRVWSEEELRKVGEICFQNDVFVVSDEIHADFRRAGQTHIPLAKLFPDEKRLITCTAPSKTFNLAGNELSNLIIADPGMAMAWKYGHVCGNPNPLSIDACKAAYTLCDDWVDELNIYLEDNLKHLKQRLEAEAPALRVRVPEGTYFGWIDARAVGISEDDMAHYLYQSGLFLEMGSEFVHNADGFIRMNTACPRSTLDRAIDILVKCFHDGNANVAEMRTRKRLTVGDKMPDFPYQTPFETEKTLSQGMDGKRTALLFLRYYGCTICQLDMHRLKAEYRQIEATGGQVKVVLQSNPAQLKRQLGEESAFPFEIICDPEQKLYHRFAISVARGQMNMLRPKTLQKAAIAKATGLTHGAYEGEELQLPACFVVEPDCQVTYVHYGMDPGDTPTPSELADLLK